MLNFNLMSSSGRMIDSNQITKPMVLFFYPKDNTPGCTIENIEFSARYPEFQQLGYEVYGISRDSVKSHCNFIAKQGLKIELLADENEDLSLSLNLIKEKSMFGKKVRGLIRSTFIISADKKILKEWREVSVTGHVDQVLLYLKSF